MKNFVQILKQVFRFGGDWGGSILSFFAGAWWFDSGLSTETLGFLALAAFSPLLFEGINKGMTFVESFKSLQEQIDSYQDLANTTIDDIQEMMEEIVSQQVAIKIDEVTAQTEKVGA